MHRFTLAFDDPKTNLLRQYAMQQYQNSVSNSQKNVSKGTSLRGDLNSAMIGRVYKAKVGCGCGK